MCLNGQVCFKFSNNLVQMPLEELSTGFISVNGLNSFNELATQGCDNQRQTDFSKCTGRICCLPGPKRQTKPGLGSVKLRNKALRTYVLVLRT